MMSMRKIIHISDMHISENVKSVLQNDKYREEWIHILQDIGNIDTMIISGDIVDKGGSQKSYSIAKEIVNQVMGEVGITHLLIVPGNHDVNRNQLLGLKGKNSIDESNLWKYYDEKFLFYKQFCKDLQLEFNPNSGLSCYLKLNDPNLIFLGLNSTNQIGEYDKEGDIDLKSLKDSLEKIFGKENGKNKEYLRIAVLHHRPIVYQSFSQSYTDNNSSSYGQYGTCNSLNWKEVSQLLLRYDVHTVLTGHVHGTQSSQTREYEELDDNIYYSTVGSIGVDFNCDTQGQLKAKIYREYEEKLKNLICYSSLNGNHNSFNILTFNDRGIVNEEQYKFFVDEGKWKWILLKKKDLQESSVVVDTEDDIFGEATDISVLQEEDVDYQEKILEIIRDNKLYKTGHFHWRGKAMLNWIDMSYFFQHREHMLLITRGIKNIIQKNKAFYNPSCMIGIGVKGSIMLSYIRYLLPTIKCSYFPENRKEYNDYELKIFNDGEKIQSIILLTDVVHSGSTIENFIKCNQDKIKSGADINVITIIDTTPSGNISNIDTSVNVNLFRLASLKAIDCQGGTKNCPIYTNRLAYVYEYEED